MFVHLTLVSGNRKVGPIPVSTTERASCPTTCSWYDKGCYAKYGPLGMHWRKVVERGMHWVDFCAKIAKLRKGTMWRHNQAGDLPGQNNQIDKGALDMLVKANKGKQGFTYTHYPMTNEVNRNAVKEANEKGFTINLSADSIEQADALADLNIAPVAVVLHKNVAESLAKIFTPKGRRVVVCPASRSDIEMDCASCGLCAVSGRKAIIGFPAHGTAAKTVSQRASLPIVG